MNGHEVDEPPGEHASFADRLAWLLRTVAAVPGTSARFSIDTLTMVLAAAEMAGPRDEGEAQAGIRAWLSSLPTLDIDPEAGPLQRRLSALETLFRLPRGYFTDAAIRRATDNRIVFAARAAAAGVQVIGPCRAAASLPVEQRHRAMVRIVTGHRENADGA